jgi:polar amino acid transport system substrate-binding protein
MRHPTRRSLLATLGGSAFLMTTACTMTPTIPPSVVSAFAPAGKLRASINLGNPILARKDSSTGEPAGVSIDLARAFAKRLGVGIELVVFDAAGKSVDAVKAEQADIGFFAIDPLRGEGIRFTAPYVLIEGAYLVRKDSPLTDNAAARADLARRGRHLPGREG